MGKKYLDTKEGSLEQSVLGVWQTAIEEGESRKTAQLHKEKLTKKQKKLDVDGDGEIEGSDLAKLRKKAKKEEVDLDEGKMKELHMLIKQGKSAEEIAKIMKLDKKTIQALMAGYMSSSYHETVEEALEWGTDELRKHTEDVTPGQDGDWVEAVNAKNKTMREALAQVWNVDEGKSPFKKENKKDGKTLTGKKVASVDINPTIKEKVK